MSSDNKRRASSPVSGEVIKRARKDSTEGLNGDSLSVAPPPNRFFQLPRELRDDIYAYAFGHGSIKLSASGLEIFAEHPDEARPYAPRKCGLSPWMLSSKQMCSEALAVFGDTREFLPMMSCSKDLEDSKEQALNPLVFNANVMRNIALRSCNQSFIKMLRSFNPSNLSLKGTRHLHPTYFWIPAPPPFPFLGINDSFWHGNFRRVEILVEVCFLPQSRLEKAMEEATAEGLRLVGAGAEVIMRETKPSRWHLYSDDDAWERMVVVQRKV